jgi:signal transduction histidine kinase
MASKPELPPENAIETPDSGRGRRSHGSDALKWALLFGLVGVLLTFHYATPALIEAMPLHNIHRHLLYLPIVLAAFWYGLRGGLGTAGVVFAFYYPHMAGIEHTNHDLIGNWADLEHLLEGLTYLIIGGLTGYLVDRLRREETRLRVALDHLRRGANELFETEEQLRLADRLAALGQLTTGLAHEIRNPLGSIRGAAEILGDPETGGEQRREFGRVLVEETERLDGVLRNFLDYARTQRGEADQPAELRPVIDRLLTLMDKKLRTAGIAVSIEVAPELPPVAIGEALLQQVLLNLMLNAVQAMGDGGRLEMTAGMNAAGTHAIVSVADSGPGIAAEIRNRVFDPFYTTKSGGSGLGLSIVHKIVSSNQGRVAIDESCHSGARLILELPVVRK